jgi:hypothetical protein
VSFNLKRPVVVAQSETIGGAGVMLMGQVVANDMRRAVNKNKQSASEVVSTSCSSNTLSLQRALLLRIVIHLGPSVMF